MTTSLKLSLQIFGKMISINLWKEVINKDLIIILLISSVYSFSFFFFFTFLVFFFCFFLFFFFLVNCFFFLVFYFFFFLIGLITCSSLYTSSESSIRTTLFGFSSVEIPFFAFLASLFGFSLDLCLFQYFLLCLINL